MFRRTRLVLALLTILTVQGALAADWPQWRGAARDGRSAETGLLQQWPEGGPPLAFSAEGVGVGYGSVSVAAGRIYLLGDLDDGEYAFALDEKDGKLLWNSRVGAKHEDQYGGSRSTPTVSGEQLYVLSTDGNVACLAVADGKQIWSRNLVEEYKGYLMKAMGSYDWQFAESPLVDGKRVVVTPGHVEAMMVALDRETGEEIWRTPGKRLGPVGADGAAYSSVVVSEAAGVKQYVQLVGRGLIGVDAESGKILWGYNRVANDIANIATPLIDGDHVFASTGYGTGAALVRVKKAEEGLEAEEVYFLEADTVQNHHGGMILDQGIVYTGSGHNKGLPIAIRMKSGEVAWGPVRTEGKSSSAIAFADGRLYFRFQDGRMILVEATADGFQEVGTFMIPEVKKESWAHPVIANGKLLLREQDRLYVYDIRQPKKDGAE